LGENATEKGEAYKREDPQIHKILAKTEGMRRKYSR